MSYALVARHHGASPHFSECMSMVDSLRSKLQKFNSSHSDQSSSALEYRVLKADDKANRKMCALSLQEKVKELGA